EQLIEEFYAGFANQNADTMVSCYHDDIQFQDPVFGILKGENVGDMWAMLIERAKGNIDIVFSDIHAKDNSGSAKWIATYHFGKINKKIINTIYSKFEFKDGLIFRQSDTFDLWNWSRQAFGWKGYMLGWTGFVKTRIQKQAIQSLHQYQSKKTK
ncbi:MAG TPA: nuclear transport factor 2 family protein, partial [Flavobacterium sp.]